jgi:urease
MGDANASIPTVQPFFPKPMWGSYPGSAALNSVLFVSQASLETGTVKSYGLSKRLEAVKHCRDISKKDMKLNDSTPKMTVNPETYHVSADDVLADIGPAANLPLGRNYNLF